MLVKYQGREPVRGTEHSAAHDCFVLEDILIPAGAHTKIPIDLRTEFDPEYVILMFPRSSVFKRGLSCPVGVIDADYRGEYATYAFNMTESDIILRKGERICQLLAIKREDFECVMADQLTQTDRGVGGFGSTGK